MVLFVAVTSGFLLALSFPTIVAGRHFPDFSWLAWVALIPYFLALFPRRAAQGVWLTFLMSVLWNGLTSYWIFNALYFNGQLSWLASLGVLAFMAVGMAVLQSVFMMLGLALARRFRLPVILTLPGAWTLCEWVRNYWPFGGYPWANLGYSQAPSLTLIQAADLFGVYGLTFLIVLVNVALAELIAALRQRQTVPWRSVAAAGGLLAMFLGYGAWRQPRIEGALQPQGTLRVGLLQPNIGPQMKGKQHLNDYILALLSQMTRRAAEQGAEFVVWPETSLPTALPLDLKEYRPLSSFTVPVLMGVLSLQPSFNPSRPVLYNSALQVDPGGILGGRIYKQHLVPLGEYVPLQKLLWFIEPIAMKMGDFRILPNRELLQVGGRRYGVVICYEDLFPELSRDFARRGAAFLVNITNDAWYGDVSQLDQHLNFSKFRAVENRRAVIRGTNNGYTAAIDPTGRIRAEIPKFIDAVLLAEIPLRAELSPYTRFGDGLWLGLLALALVSCLAVRAAKPREV